MSAPRRPKEVTADFQADLAARLAPLGFEPRAKGTLVRKRGKNVHRIAFHSSHFNTSGYAVAWPSFTFEDGLTRKRVKGWSAGGILGGPAFSLEAPQNVADPEQAEALAKLIVEQVGFFEWLEDPAAVLTECSRRYVPGLIDPLVIAPYLRVRLGPESMRAYANALLRGRPELGPGFLAALAEGASEAAPATVDHGTQLGIAVLLHGEGLRPEVAPGTVTSARKEARHLRNHFGLQLRAWGEPEVAAKLARCGDDEVRGAQVLGSKVDDVEPVLRLLALLGEKDRAPSRAAPMPRLFQYCARHAPWAA